APPTSTGVVTFKVNGTSSEITVGTTITDVRCLPGTGAAVCNSPNAADGPDYSGQLQANNTIWQTHHHNGPGLDETATVIDIPNPVNLTCANTTSTTTGGVCTVGSM